MDAVIIYESLTGNTAKASNMIAQELRSAGVPTTVCRITSVDYQALADADLVIVGTWVDGIFVVGQRPGRRQRLRRLPILDRKRCLVFCTYAINPGKTLEKMSRLLEGRGANVLGGMTIRRNDLEGGAKEFVERLIEAIPA
jgi:sulfite reductase alpha subunit-like flavoprotein